MDEGINAHLPIDKSLIGVFTNRKSAESAYGLLRDMGYLEDDISVLMSDEARVRYFPAPGLRGEVIGDTLDAPPGFTGVVGAGAGTALGALLGTVASLALPGSGLVGVGPLAAALGAILGGMSGGLLGSLIGIGFSKDHAKKFEEKINQGNIIIAVNPRSEEDTTKIIQEWEAAGGEIIIR